VFPPAVGGAGLSASLQQDLIVRLKLPLALEDQLDSWVQAVYRDLWEKALYGKPRGSQEEQ